MSILWLSLRRRPAGRYAPRMNAHQPSCNRGPGACLPRGESLLFAHACRIAGGCGALRC